VIAVDNLRKAYGRTVAVDAVSFVAPDGMVTGLLGPNGAGKTTTLRVLTGLVAADNGTASIDGLRVAANPVAARRLIGVLPEIVGLYDRLSVREHLVYAGQLHGLASRVIDDRVSQLMRQLGLDGLASRRAGELSLGEARRVALARALVHDPRNVVLDEPTNGLDVLSARHVRREVRQLAAAGRAVLLSSHVMPEVSAVCDRIVILSKGLVAAAGTPHEILARTATATLEDAFVAIIGSEEGLN
jgi:sodium transport system ATP-binding protein